MPTHESLQKRNEKGSASTLSSCNELEQRCGRLATLALVLSHDLELVVPMLVMLVLFSILDGQDGHRRLLGAQTHLPELARVVPEKVLFVFRNPTLDQKVLRVLPKVSARILELCIYALLCRTCSRSEALGGSRLIDVCGTFL
jgi:hypothetical protein